MPRYDFSCDLDHVFEVFLAPQRLKTLDLGQLRLPCQECGAPAKWKPTAQVAPTFTPTVVEHLGPEPVVVESREHYKELLFKSDSYGPYVEPGSKDASVMKEFHTERRAKSPQEESDAATG